MPALTFLSRLLSGTDHLTSSPAGLCFRTNATGDSILYVTTRHDGAVTAWSLGQDGAMTRLSSVAYPGGSGGMPGMTIVGANGATGSGAILAGGGGAGGLMLVPILASGALGRAQPVGAVTGTAADGRLAGDLASPVAVTLPDGRVMVYAGITGAAGIAGLTFAAADPGTGIGSSAVAGTGIRARLTRDTGDTHADRVTTLTTFSTGTRDILVTASRIDPGLTAWEIAANGTLSPLHSLGTGAGLWIAEPTAIGSARVGGRDYLVLASAGSSSLSVIEIGTDGVMSMRSHLVDDRDSRFGGATALAVVEHRGLTYVVAGGADDGISLFLLLPGGLLIAEAHLADSPAMTLANVSAIAATSGPRGIEIVVASASEPGLTRLRFDPGPAGLSLAAGHSAATLTGGAGRDLIRGGPGNDSLVGGAGDDIILDGAGSDRMAGGPGADLFILARDGAPDTITDFDPAMDRLNLTAWPGLRSLEQLFMTPLPNGLRITYGAEVLVLLSANGRPILPGMLTFADHVGGTLLPPVAERGHPGPPKPDPPLPPRISPEPPIFGGAAGDRLTGGPRDDRIFGQGGDDFIFGGGGNDLLYGGSGRDRLHGDDGNDTLFGGAGNDSLYGGAGDDVLHGEDGNDRLFGGSGNDGLFGGKGNDRLDGGSGDDRLTGGGGHDTLAGGAGRDLLFGGGGRDLLRGGAGADTLFGGGGHDRLYGGGGNDSLSGGTGNDLLYGGSGHDRLAGGSGRDSLFGGKGNDTLIGNGGHDRLTGGGGSDTLFGGTGRDVLRGGSGDDSLSGGAGDDRLFGGGGRDTLHGGTGNDVLTGGKGADLFIFRRGDGHDRITDFGTRGDRLQLDTALWRGRHGALTPDEVVSRFAGIDQGDVLFRFGGGQSLRLDDLDNLSGLARLIDLG